MKYVAWVNINAYYKSHILKNLNELQYFNFLMLFFQNRNLAEFIFLKKLYNVLYLKNLYQYHPDELIKLNKLFNSSFISLKIIKLSSEMIYKINYHHINKHNIHNLLLIIRDFCCNQQINIVWGPGNHDNPINNLKQHYKKHILSDEGIYWKDLIFNINDYKNYAINSFYKMKKVIVHTNGKHIYLSGFYGNVFIIGRYHEYVFGISSCYYVVNGEKPGRYKNKCFDIVFN